MATGKKFASEAARLAKNKQISQTRAATKDRRAKQACKVYTLKLSTRKLSSIQREALERVFLEAKWLRNTALASDDPFTHPWQPKTAQVKLPTGHTEERELKYLGSQVRQSILEALRRDARSLAALKKNGRRIGKLKFAREVKSIEYKQEGTTWRVRGQKVALQGLPGLYRVRGLQQLTDKELANAKLLRRANGYYLAVTAYEAKKEKTEVKALVGLDFGLKTHITTSQGQEVNVLVQETERHRRLQKRMARQVKGSKNWHKTRHALGKSHQQLVNRKNDAANKFVAGLTNGAFVVFQDDNLNRWKSKKSLARGGKTIQYSMLGRVKVKLSYSENAFALPRYLPTSKLCVCGVKNQSLALADRVFRCATCGYERPRDLHAAENMVRFALVSGQELPAVPVEGLSDWNREAYRLAYQQGSVKQETDGAQKAQRSRPLVGEASGSSAQM